MVTRSRDEIAWQVGHFMVDLSYAFPNHSITRLEIPSGFVVLITDKDGKEILRSRDYMYFEPLVMDKNDLPDGLQKWFNTHDSGMIDRPENKPTRPPSVTIKTDSKEGKVVLGE